MRKEHNEFRVFAQEMGNLLLAICVSASCMYIITRSDVLSVVSVIRGLMTAGAVFCVGYLGKLRLLGGEGGKRRGKELFPLLLAGFLICFMSAVFLG